MRYTLTSEQHDEIYQGEQHGVTYPLSSSAACTVLCSRGVKVTPQQLAVAIEEGALPECKDGRNRRWTKKHLDMACDLFYRLGYLTPQTEMCRFLNVDPVSWVRATREAEKTGRTVDVQTMILSPANPALGEMRQVRFE